MKDLYGDDIRVKRDSHYDPAGDDVREVVVLEVFDLFHPHDNGEGNIAVLTPDKARKLARKLKRAADEAEADL